MDRAEAMGLRQRMEFEFPEIAVWQMLEQSSQRWPDRPALRFFGRRITYRELWRQVESFARGLVARGIVPGDRVALVLPNSPQMVIGYFGALRAGAVVVPTNPLYTEREFAVQLGDAGVRLAVCLDLMHQSVARGIDDAAGERIIVTRVRDYLPPVLALLQGLKERGPRLLPRAIPFRNLTDGRDAAELPPPADPGSLAVLQYTGGTTGTPKGAMLTHRNLVANAYQCQVWLADVQMEGHRVLGVLPFFHVFGMTAAMNLGLLDGGEIDLVPRWKTDDVLKEIARFRPTTFPGAPAMYHAIVTAPSTAKVDLSSIAVCISGSAPLPGILQEEFERRTGGRLVEGYGLTEASPVTHCNPLVGPGKPGTIGLPYPATEHRILDPNDPSRELPQGEVGELAVRGPQVMAGYYNRPEETAQTLRDGWLLTGDLARIHEDGYCEIVDRKKDLIIVSGFNVYPREVEEVLLRHPAVRDTAVVGIPDEHSGQIVCAFIVPTPDVEVSFDELRRYCRQTLAGYKVPRRFELRTDLPRSAIGKVLRRELFRELQDVSNAKEGV